MKALISGQAATAVLIDGENLYSFDLSTLGKPVRRKEWEIPLLLADVSDVQEIDNTSESAVIEELELAWTKDRALQLILILLGSDEDADIRFEAAECLDEFLNNSTVSEYIANRLYSAPLAPNADVKHAIAICSDASLNTVRELLQEIDGDQEEVKRRHQAWLDLPISLFGSPQDKDNFFFDAVRFGAFRMFATERGRKNWALLQLLFHPYFRGDAVARVVFREWAAPFKESASGSEFETNTKDESLFDEVEREIRKARSGVRPHEAFTQAEKQREAIKNLIAEGNQDLALRYTEELVTSQRRTSDPEHIAKSLCDLAQFSKKIGSPEFQLEFAKRAIQEAPTDAWSYITVGDAYRALADYQNALDAYHQAGVFGDEFSAMLGRAQVFKDIGQLYDAISILDRLIADYPGEIVAQNSRAAALADFGKHGDSLKAYDTIAAEFPYDSVTLTGRAQVLREMGRFEDALEQLRIVIAQGPDDSRAEYTRGEIFREIGQLDKALDIFAELKRKYPLAAEVHYAYARILRDLGRFDKAITRFKRLIETHPLSPFGYIGLAESYRKVGEKKKAHQAYDIIIERFPRSMTARNGKASIFMSQGDYSSAVKLLPTNLPATFSEWVSYHIRGMGWLRSGKLLRAERIFEKGVAEVPWIEQKQYFRTALASVRIQQKRFEESIELVRDIKSPSIKALAQVISMHAMGELGDTAGVERAFQSVEGHAAPIVINLRDAIAAKYMRRAAQQSAWSEDRVFVHECDSLLLAA